MIYVLLALAIIGSFIYLIRKGRIENLSDFLEHKYALYLFLLLVWSVLGGLIIAFRTSTNVVSRPNETSVSLVGLKDFTSREGSMSGGFFLVLGAISGSQKDMYKIRYATYVNGNIQIKTLKVDEDNVFFVEDGLNKLVVSSVSYAFVYTEMGKVLFWNDSPDVRPDKHTSKQTYTFHVPKGSIFNEFNVDLE